jgi:hypothetical protein
MSDDLLSAFGRKQREDLDDGGEPSSAGEDELTRPFDEDERASILDALFDRVDEVATVSGGPSHASPSAGPSNASPSAGPSNVIELAPRRRGALIGSLLAVAAAAALVWWGWPESGVERELVASVPAYTFTQLGGGIAEKRSAPDGPANGAMPELELRANSSIDWVLTPTKPTRDPIGVALLARSDAGETKFVERLDVVVTEQGVVRLRGPLDKHVPLGVGAWTLTLFIAPSERLPADADVASNADVASDGASAWRNLALRVIIVPDE